LSLQAAAAAVRPLQAVAVRADIKLLQVLQLHLVQHLRLLLVPVVQVEQLVQDLMVSTPCSALLRLLAVAVELSGLPVQA
jgi:hypothetical protein